MSMEKFHWTSPSGVEIVLPHMDKLPGGVIRKNRKLDPMDLMFTLLEAVADDNMLAKVDALSLGEQTSLFENWQEGTVSVGESSSSST